QIFNFISLHKSSGRLHVQQNLVASAPLSLESTVSAGEGGINHAEIPWRRCLTDNSEFGGCKSNCRTTSDTSESICAIQPVACTANDPVAEQNRRVLSLFSNWIKSCTLDHWWEP